MWGIGFGAWSAENITDDLTQWYLEYHKDRPDEYVENFMLENNGLSVSIFRHL